MNIKPKHKRLINIITLLIFIFIGAFALAKTFRENLIYFYSPTDLENLQTENPQKLESLTKRKMRIGGLVKEGSLQKVDALNTNFIITDEKFDIKVSYNGILPPLFRELQGMVAEGNLKIENASENVEKNSGDNSSFIFTAENLLTKHDENYMPPEVAESLKKKIHDANENSGIRE